jgi:23S rRNA (pseudouridine1915-N3)-methyltransferase
LRSSIAAVRILVLSVGRTKPPWADDVEHYRRLLGRHARVELIEVREDEQVERRIPDRAYVVLLDRGGEAMTSEAFAAFLEQRRQAARDLCFVVGGAFGLELARAHRRLAFGPQTLAHGLARVVLLEQLYRGHKILAHEPYHH